MPATLEEALQEVDLQPGRKYRFQVRGRWIELRVLEETAPETTVEAEVPIPAWVDLPEPESVGWVQAREAPPEMPSIPDIPAEDDSE